MNENQYDTTYDNNKKKQHGGQKTTIKNAKSTLDLFRKVNGLKVSSVDVKKQQEERLRRRTMMSSPRSSSSSSTLVSCVRASLSNGIAGGHVAQEGHTGRASGLCQPQV